MAVTVSAELVAEFSGETRPPGHAGWNNPAGDPDWVKDVDWYRRVRLTCSGPEVGGIVNWEIFDGSIPLKTTAEINALADGSLGSVINNTTTWSAWAYTGINVAGKAYKDTKSSAVVTLRANGPVVQVLLGNRPIKKDLPAPPSFKVYAFLPGSGKTPAGSATLELDPPSVTVTPETATVVAAATQQLVASVSPDQASQEVTWASSDGAIATVDADGLVTGVAAGEATVTATSLTFGVSDTSQITVTATGGEVRVTPDEPVVEEDYPEGGTIAEIKAWVGDDEDRAQDALDAEAARDNPRVTLIEYLEGMLGIGA